MKIILLLILIIFPTLINSITLENAIIEYKQETMNNCEILTNKINIIIDCVNKTQINIFKDLHLLATSINDSKKHIINNSLINQDKINIALTTNNKTEFQKININKSHFYINNTSCNFEEYETILISGENNKIEIKDKNILNNISKNIIQIQKPVLLEVSIKKNNTIYYIQTNTSLNCFNQIKIAFENNILKIINLQKNTPIEITDNINTYKTNKENIFINDEIKKIISNIYYILIGETNNLNYILKREPVIFENEKTNIINHGKNKKKLIEIKKINNSIINKTNYYIQNKTENKTTKLNPNIKKIINFRNNKEQKITNNSNEEKNDNIIILLPILLIILIIFITRH